ncbi:HPr kinase/phosphorylase [Halovulum marinum]|uniref:HPr kinase/phosphorylase n=1 Tax=Halovulum marinum TaxID=2662447 RepID=UPI002D788984|nr:serine kinase [Halovulum marinum]
MAWRGRAALLLGRSGSGKSAVALQMMALGADLVADDQVLVHASAGGLVAEAPAALAGKIEARGIGLIRVRHLARARIVLAVDLEMHEDARLPQPRKRKVNSMWLPLIAGGNRPYLSHEVMACLRHGCEPLLLDPEEPIDADRD